MLRRKASRHTTYLLPLAMLGANACAGATTRVGEKAPLTDKTGKLVGQSTMIDEITERQSVDADRNGIPEKQLYLERGKLVRSETFFPDGKIRVRTWFANGLPTRSEVYRQDGSLRGVAFHKGRDKIDTVDLPARQKRVEFLEGE